MAKTPAQRAAKHGDRATPGPIGMPIQPPNSRTSGSTVKAKSNGNLILIVGVVGSVFLFWYFHLLTLNQLTQLSNGLAMPDSIPFGFDANYIAQLKAVLNSDALGQLQYVHKTAGTLFPVVFALSWLLLIGLKVGRPALRWMLWAVPLCFAIIQLVANVAIDAMLSNSSVNSVQVAWASALTSASWLLLALSLLASIVAFSPFAQKPQAQAAD